VSLRQPQPQAALQSCRWPPLGAGPTLQPTLHTAPHCCQRRARATGQLRPAGQRHWPLPVVSNASPRVSVSISSCAPVSSLLIVLVLVSGYPARVSICWQCLRRCSCRVSSRKAHVRLGLLALQYSNSSSPPSSSLLRPPRKRKHSHGCACQSLSCAEQMSGSRRPGLNRATAAARIAAPPISDGVARPGRHYHAMPAAAASGVCSARRLGAHSAESAHSHLIARHRCYHAAHTPPPLHVRYKLPLRAAHSTSRWGPGPAQRGWTTRAWNPPPLPLLTSLPLRTNGPDRATPESP